MSFRRAAGQDRFRPERNLILKKPQQPDQPAAFPYATLRFPLPQQIASLQVAAIRRDAFTNQDDLLVDGDQHIATVQVFTYEVEDQNALFLKARDGEGHYWEPVLTGDHINLHIFCAEDHYHKPSNAQEDFNQCADLVGGVKLRLQTRSLLASGILDAGQLPPGVVDQETESLALRTAANGPARAPGQPERRYEPGVVRERRAGRRSGACSGPVF